jgi:hypothetical protein
MIPTELLVRLEAPLGKVIADNTVISEVLPEIKRLAPGSTPRLSVNGPCPSCFYPQLFHAFHVVESDT